MGASIMVADASLKEIESTRTVYISSLARILRGSEYNSLSKRCQEDYCGTQWKSYLSGYGKDQYVCFPENFCACYSFFYDVVNRAEQLCCKHQIATKMAALLGACVEVKVSDEELALLPSKI